MNLLTCNTHRILVVDDNQSIHDDFHRILSSKKSTHFKFQNLQEELLGCSALESALPAYEVDDAFQGQAAVKKVEEAIESGKPYALAFVDIRMPPGWDGVETIKHMWVVDPDIQIVICTAYSDYKWEETIEQLGKNDNLLLLKKPFDIIVVRQLAQDRVNKWAALQMRV